MLSILFYDAYPRKAIPASKGISIPITFKVIPKNVFDLILATIPIIPRIRDKKVASSNILGM